MKYLKSGFLVNFEKDVNSELKKSRIIKSILATSLHVFLKMWKRPIVFDFSFALLYL